MKKLAIIPFVFLCFTSFGQSTWVIDATHSTVEFEVSHLTVSSVTGYFTSFEGSIITTKKNEFQDAKVSATIDVESVTTNNLERDKHLKEDDFFNAKKYPTIKFTSTSFEKYEDGSYSLTGDLTIRDVTKSVDLEVDFGGIVSLNNMKRAGFTAKGTINRFDYGLKWDDALDSGGLIVGEKVDLIINVEAVKK
ncbi:YceI family protein [Fulvivirga lutea]|uniref:YceI family protein n=1 Tax=Fulvivirga lutea TaxID=2810512 RepID=A0A974WJ48_9BACT|nr:YceI family protein [Fulvivirga lutea]QSE99135.1 YceI family protein [Fulvivirga lutea]